MKKKFFILLFLGVTLFILSFKWQIVLAYQLPTEDNSTHHEKINWFSFSDKETPPLIANIINFVIFALILYFALRKPLKNYLELRHKTIKEKLEEAEKLKSEMEMKYKEYTRKLEELDKILASLKEEYRKLGEQRYNRIVAEAEKKGEKIIEDVKKVIEMEREHAIEELRRFAIEVGIEMAEKLLKERLRAEDKERLFKESIEELRSQEIGK